jgi:hypothetical protein
VYYAPFWIILAIFILSLTPALVAALFGGGRWMVASASFGGVAAVTLLGTPIFAFASGYKGLGFLRPILGSSGDLVEPTFFLASLSFGCMLLSFRSAPDDR